MASGDGHAHNVKRSGCARGCLVVLAALLLFVVALGFAGGIYISGVEEDINRRAQAIADAGEPVNLADIDAWTGPPVADEDNAAIPLQKAMDSLREPTGLDVLVPFVNNVEMPKLTEPLPENMKAAIVDYLEPNQASAVAVGEAAKRRDCRFPVNYAASLYTGSPHHNRLRWLERMMCAKAIYEAETGEPDETLRTIVAGVRLAEALRHEPLLDSQLLRIAMRGNIVEAIERSLNRITFSSEQLKSLQDEIEKINTGDCVYKGLLGERCVLLDDDIWDSACSGLSSSGPLGTNRGLFAWRNCIDRRYGIAAIGSIIDAAKLSPAEAMPRIDRICNELSPERRSKFQQFLTVQSDNMIPAFERYIEVQARDTSSLDCVTEALALLRYHEDRGAFPQALGELVPEYLEQTPIDCMDGRPLRYLHDNGGFTVYSVGPNKKDDGGQPPEKKSDIGTLGDMTFAVRLRTDSTQ